jgi:chaperonin GroEL
MKLDNVTLSMLGSAKKVKISKEDTVIVEGAGSKVDIESRCAQIRKQIEDTTSDYDKEKLQKKLTKLISGVAILKINNATEIEVKERKDRVDDALHATRAAVEEGIVAGGGVALLRASQALKGIKVNDVQKWGVDIVRRACEEPIRQIATNAGLDGSIVADKVLSDKNPNFGFNAYNEEYSDLVKDGVIDPVKVVRSALQNAASISSLMLTTETMIAEKPKKEGAAPAAPGMGGMGGMDMM